MKDEDKTKEQLLYEVGEMQRRIAELEAAVVRSRLRPAPVIPSHADDRLSTGGEPISAADPLISTQSIDLTSIFTEDVTSSGSFSFLGVDRTWFGKLLQAMPIAALLVNEEGRVVFMNECCRRISEDCWKIIGKPFSSVFCNPWVAQEAEKLVQKVFNLRLRESIEAVLEINGGRIWGRLYFRSIRLGETRSVLVLIEDLTLEKEQLVLKQQHAEEIQKERDELDERVRQRTMELAEANEQLVKEIADRESAEEQRTRSEARYGALVQNAPVGIVSCTLSGDVTEHNPAVARILGMQADDQAGDINLLTFPPLVEAGVSRAIRKCLEEGSPCLSEFPYKGEGGKQIIARLHVVPMTEAGGSIVGAQAVVEDISERKRADWLMLRSERLKALVEMASGVAHNFSTSLQVVAAYSQTALACAESGNLSEVLPLLEQIRDSARQTAQTVRRLQQFSLSRAAVRPAQIKVFDVKDAVEEGIEKSKLWWKTIPEEQGVAVALAADLSPGCLVEGDYLEIVEVVENLIKNSVEALPAGGLIRVRAGLDKGDVLIQVQDDGIGIPKKSIEKIFEPFWTSKPSHVGMGLAVTSGIVRRHKGSLAVYSKERTGTRIGVRLPCSESSESRGDESLGRQRLRLRVLLISEDESSLAALEAGFKRLDQTPFVAFSGEMGIRVLEEHDIDAVICDRALPDMSSWDLSERVRDMFNARGTPRPPFIMLAEGADQAEEDEAPPCADIDHIIEKPAEVSELLETIAAELQHAPDQATFSGRIRGIDILEYVQLVLLSQQTLVVEISSREKERGLVYVDKGSITHAVCGDLIGEEALYRCLTFKGGSFSSLPWRAPESTTITKPGELLLLEAARIRDEMTTVEGPGDRL